VGPASTRTRARARALAAGGRSGGGARRGWGRAPGGPSATAGVPASCSPPAATARPIWPQISARAMLAVQAPRAAALRSRPQSRVAAAGRPSSSLARSRGAAPLGAQPSASGRFVGLPARPIGGWKTAAPCASSDALQRPRRGGRGGAARVAQRAGAARRAAAAAAAACPAAACTHTVPRPAPPASPRSQASRPAAAATPPGRVARWGA
jgi:hypothetical protein